MDFYTLSIFSSVLCEYDSDHHDLHSYPTRRTSDLRAVAATLSLNPSWREFESPDGTWLSGFGTAPRFADLTWHFGPPRARRRTGRDGRRRVRQLLPRSALVPRLVPRARVAAERER